MLVFDVLKATIVTEFDSNGNHISNNGVNAGLVDVGGPKSILIKSFEVVLFDSGDGELMVE